MVSKREKQPPDALTVLRDDIENLRSEMDRVARPYEELSQKLDTVQEYAQRYLRLLGIIAQHGTVSPTLAVPDVKDSISKEIISLLAERSPMNISQITDAVREKRGTASRRIIRQRLSGLVGKGHVEVAPGKIRGYSLSEDVVKKWSQMLTGLK